MCVLFVLIGFSTWIMLPIRANSNININENKPSDAAEVLAYYNREQYGEQNYFTALNFLLCILASMKKLLMLTTNQIMKEILKQENTLSQITTKR